MKPKKLEWLLSELRGFDEPKVHLEQYATSPELAVSIMEAIDNIHPIEGSLMADLGCGCGMLMTAASVAYSPGLVVGVDIDDEALEVCRENLDSVDVLERCDLLNANVLRIGEMLPEQFDIVVMNPPFGTKKNSGLDMEFVEAGLSILKDGGSLFSLHKTSTRDFILKKGKKWKDVKVECVAQLRWDLPATYKFHKKKSVDIDVDLMHFKKIKRKEKGKYADDTGNDV